MNRKLWGHLFLWTGLIIFALSLPLFDQLMFQAAGQGGILAVFTFMALLLVLAISLVLVGWLILRSNR